MYERTADTPWAAVPLLDEEAPTLWLKSPNDLPKHIAEKGYSIQYRPRKRRVKPKSIKTSGHGSLDNRT